VADIITTKDLSVEDTSKLKTGDTKRRYDMPGKACDNIKDPKQRADCKAYKGKYAVIKKKKK
tara:strand:+ start:533 stop:718 length:186 start_codon:yes stop_codon:yes gene_type:complete